MLGLGQKLTLESFQILLNATFLIDSLNLSQNSALFRDLNHF